MKNKKGFTLLELLIAAAIIGSLAVLATVSYRSSESDTRAAAAHLKVKELAAAVQRFNLEYPSARPISGVMSNVSTVSSCGPYMINDATHATNPTNQLIFCDFVDNGGWNNLYFEFKVCGVATDCSGHGTGLTNPLACAHSKGYDRMITKYGSNYWYCADALKTGERFNN